MKKEYKTPIYQRNADKLYCAKKTQTIKHVGLELANLIDRYQDFGFKTKIEFSRRIASDFEKYWNENHVQIEI
jgi:hypothetical protein